MADLNDLVGGAGSGGDDENNHNKNNDSTKKIYETPLKRDLRKPSRSSKGSSSSPGEESCSEATAITSTALTPMTVGSLASTGSETHQMEVEVQRDKLQHQMVLLSVATTATLAIFILTIVPFVTLLTFSLLATSAGLLSYTAFQRLVLEYQEIIAREGFGRFLPPSMISLLTNQSLHQFLRDDTFVRE